MAPEVPHGQTQARLRIAKAAMVKNTTPPGTAGIGDAVHPGVTRLLQATRVQESAEKKGLDEAVREALDDVMAKVETDLKKRMPKAAETTIHTAMVPLGNELLSDKYAARFVRDRQRDFPGADPRDIRDKLEAALTRYFHLRGIAFPSR